MSRGTDTGFGIRDLPQESTIKAKIRPLRQNRDFFGTILAFPGLLVVIFMKMQKTCEKGKK